MRSKVGNSEVVGNKKADAKLEGVVVFNDKLYDFIAMLVRAHVLEFGVKRRKHAKKWVHRKDVV